VKKRAVATAALAMKAVRDVGAEIAPRGPLRMCGATAPLEELRRALLAADGTDATAVDIFAARRLRPDDAEPLGRAAVVVYGAEVVASLDDATRADLEVVGRAGRPLVAILEGVDLPDEALLEAARVPGVHPMSVLPSKRGRFPVRKAMRLLAERAGSAGPALAARLPAFRPYVVQRLIEMGSRRNGLVATAVWIPAPTCRSWPPCSCGWCFRSGPATASSSRPTGRWSSWACSGPGSGSGRSHARCWISYRWQDGPSRAASRMAAPGLWAGPRTSTSPVAHPPI